MWNLTWIPDETWKHLVIQKQGNPTSKNPTFQQNPFKQCFENWTGPANSTGSTVNRSDHWIFINQKPAANQTGKNHRFWWEPEKTGLVQPEKNRFIAKHWLSYLAQKSERAEKSQPIETRLYGIKLARIILHFIDGVYLLFLFHPSMWDAQYFHFLLQFGMPQYFNVLLQFTNIKYVYTICFYTTHEYYIWFFT